MIVSRFMMSVGVLFKGRNLQGQVVRSIACSVQF